MKFVKFECKNCYLAYIREQTYSAHEFMKECFVNDPLVE